MKQLLLIILMTLGFTSMATAQSRVKTINADTVSITSISEKIDAFIVSQAAVTANLETKINRANIRLQDLQNQSSLRWLLRDMIPIIILVFIGGFVILIIFMLTRSIYQNKKLKYETLLRCTEMTGSVPNLFVQQEIAMGNRLSKRTIQTIVAIISGITAILTAFGALFGRGSIGALFMIICFFTALISILLFIQIFQRNNIETNRANQQ